MCIKSKLIVGAICITSIGIAVGEKVNALTYQSEVNPSFTINPSLSVSLSSPNLVISDLAPGSISDSNEIVVTVLSNNRTGYVLNSSVGSSTSPYSSYGRNLINSNIGTSGASNTLFSSLDYSTAPATTTLTTPSTWGYQYATSSSDDDNGNVVYNDWSNYNGLPLYSDTTNVATLNSNSGPSLSTGDKLKFRIGAYADTTQLSGEYTNLINFTAVANATPTTLSQAFYEAAQNDPSITKLNGYYKMQDMNAAICSAAQEMPSEISLIDTRDNEVYLVSKLADDRCWMKDNLRLGSNTSTTVLHNTDSNINTTSWILPQGITSGFDSYTVAQINAAYKNDTNATGYGTGSGKIGVYYNYCATSAGTYCMAGGNGVDMPGTTIDSPYDVCPKNWRMPTGDINGEYQLLYNQYDATQDATNINSFQYNLSISLSGRFHDSAQGYLNTFGLFWSATYNNRYRMYRPLASATYVAPAYDDGGRSYGNSIRCIVNNE